MQYDKSSLIHAIWFLQCDLWMQCYEFHVMNSMLWMKCYEWNSMNAILWMYCMQSNEMSAMSDSMIAFAAGSNLAIFILYFGWSEAH